VPVVFLIAIAVVLVGIFFAATGRGGELAYEHADHAPLDLGPVSAADIALLRPPTAMWGYNMQVTDEALDQIARAMRERDVTIAYLQEQLATYERNGPYSEYSEPRGAHAREVPGAPGPADTLDPPGIFQTPGPPTIPDPPEALGPPESSGPPEPPEAPGPPRTALILKASKPEPHDATQPSPALPDPGDERDVTQPSAALPQDDAPGPQGSFDTHGWWAEQQQAAHEEQASGQAAGEQDDESVAAAEEQGW
jgi:hypothetical protein